MEFEELKRVRTLLREEVGVNDVMGTWMQAVGWEVGEIPCHYEKPL